MVEFVGKIVPGAAAIILGLKGMSYGVEIIGMPTFIILGWMILWGITVAYYPFLDLIEETRDYLHRLSERKLREMGEME